MHAEHWKRIRTERMRIGCKLIRDEGENVRQIA